MTTVTLRVRCVFCKHVEKVDAQRVYDTPMCPKCFSPMVVIGAEHR